MAAQNLSFPVDSALPDLAAALHNAGMAVLIAPPGAGKTTRVPTGLLSTSGFPAGKILMLEPRRLAARRAAEYMASLAGETVGETIGYRIRTFINGVPAADLKDDMTATGFIALQVHGIGNREETLHVQYRNVRIQDLGEKTDYRTPDIAPYSHDGPLVKDGAAFRKLGGDFKFTEGPALAPDGKIYFSDIPNERIHAFDPKTGAITVFRESSGKANGLFFTPSGALVACEGGNRRLTRTTFDGKVEPLAETFDGKKFNSPNDVVPDGHVTG